jgi:hypothetical protein
MFAAAVHQLSSQNVARRCHLDAQLLDLRLSVRIEPRPYRLKPTQELDDNSKILLAKPQVRRRLGVCDSVMNDGRINEDLRKSSLG